jgi:mannosyl-oligosaccharide glucosidase
MEHGYSGDVVFKGQSSAIEDYTITIAQSRNSHAPAHDHPSYEGKPLVNTFVDSIQVPEEALWQSKGK